MEMVVAYFKAPFSICPETMKSSVKTVSAHNRDSNWKHHKWKSDLSHLCRSTQFFGISRSYKSNRPNLPSVVYLKTYGLILL